MEESLEPSHPTIPLESLITILSDLHFLAKIRYNKTSSFYNNTLKDNETNNHKNNVFDFFRKNLDENKYNLFKKEKNFFHVENNPNSDFPSDLFYYTSNESISLIEVKKKQKDFYDFFDNFVNNFKNKISEMIKDETLYYDNDLLEDPNKKNSWNKKESINTNFMKIISNNMLNNCNKKGNKSNCKLNGDKYFMFMNSEDDCFYKDKGFINNNSYDKRKNFNDFINDQKSKRPCFDFNLKDNDFLKTESLKNVLIVLKSEGDFKKFFNEFIKENNSMTSESPSFQYNLSTIKTNEQRGSINLDFQRFLKILWNNLNLIYLSKKIEFTNDRGLKENINFVEKIQKGENLLLNAKNLKQILLKIYTDKFNLISNYPNALEQNMLDLLSRQSFNYLITLETEEQFYLGFYNIAKRNYLSNKTEFHLHRAIYENNIKKINDLCKNESNESLFSPINEIDHMGNSPLHLAIRLNRLDAIQVICDNNAEIKHFAYDDAITPYDYAIINKNVSVLKILVNAIKKQKLTYWHENQKELADVIKNIPDFSMVFTVSLNSTIFSVIKSITPKDIFKISKKDSNIRIDMNISSLNTALRAFKGKHSLIIQENCNTITITRLDYQKKISYDYIDSITEIKDDENKVEELIAEGWKTKKLNNISLKIHSQSNKKKDEKILGYESQSIIAKGFIYWMKRKLNKKRIEDLCASEKKNFATYKSFDDYAYDKSNLAFYFDLELNFYGDKYSRILDAMLKQIEQQINKAFVCSNKCLNNDKNENNSDNNNIKNKDNSAMSNYEINNKQLNPLLFSFGNPENIHKTFPDLHTPTKHSHSHFIQSNDPNKENQNNNDSINENHQRALINLLLIYSTNSNIRISFEKDLLEKGIKLEGVNNNEFSEIDHNKTSFPMKNEEFKKNKIPEKKQDHKGFENTSVSGNQINSENKFYKNYNSNLANDYTLYSKKSLNIPLPANSSTLTTKKFTNFKNFNNSKYQNVNSSINKYDQIELINKNLTKAKEEEEENLIEKKISQKEISLSLLTSKDFPIKVFHFIPLIHILSFTSTEFTQLNSFLCSDFLPFDAFPLKIDFPLGLSLNASLAITEFKSDIIQDISISDFQNENNNNNKNFWASNRNNKNSNNNYFKDLSSNANHSTALLDDKYAREFYDRYFKEKNVGAFSEFSEESFNNKDNIMRGSKSNYSELFRDEELPAEDLKRINYSYNDFDNNEIEGGKAAKKTTGKQAEFILTELKNEIEYEEHNEEKIIFENKTEKNKKTDKLGFTKIQSNQAGDNLGCFEAEVARERESSKGEPKNTETSVPKRHHSIATNQYKNKKIGLNTIIMNQHSSKNISSLNNKNNLYSKQSINCFLNDNTPKNENTIEFYKASKATNNQNMLNAKKTIQSKLDIKENRDPKTKSIYKKSNNNNATLKSHLPNESAKKQSDKNLNEESLLSASKISISDFEKTLEENTTLNISKYTQNFKFNKPPEFKQRIRKYLKVPDLNKNFNFNASNNFINNNNNNNNYNHQALITDAVLFPSTNKNENEAFKIIDNDSSRDLKSKNLNSHSRNEPNYASFVFANKKNFLDAQSQFTYNSANCNKTSIKDQNITINRHNLIYGGDKAILDTVNQDFNNSNNNYNNTMNNLESDFQKKYFNPHDINNDNKTIDNLNNFNNNTCNNNRTNNANNSIYIPAAEFNNYYIPTYSNAEMNDLDKNSVLDHSITNNYNVNKTEKNLNMENFILGSKLNPIKNIATEANLDHSAQSPSFNKDFIFKNSRKINFNNSNIINTKEFHYNNVNTENLNFDTISLCVRNENNSENCKYNPQNNLTINSRIEKLNKKVYNQPWKMMRKVTENKQKAEIKGFNTIDFTENWSKKEQIDSASNKDSVGYYNNSECNNNNLNLDNEIDENYNYFLQHEESNPLEKTVFNKINNMKILPTKFLSRNVNSNFGFNSILGKGFNDKKENLVKKRNPIPKYVSNRDKRE